ncbi:hypothetical protein WA538_004549, partial [Blastocystis sp. DL]
MRLSIQIDRESFQDRITGAISIRNASCISRNRTFKGYVSLCVLVILDTHAGLFSRKRFTLYEERKEILLAVGQPNSFEFRRSDMEKNAKMTLPDSYSGFGISVRYCVTAKCHCLFPVSSSCSISIKRHKEEKMTPEELYISKNDINDFDGLLCASDVDFVPEVHATCKIHSSHICMSEGISGVLNVDQCNMEIQSISVAVVQQETIKVRNVEREFQIVRDTIEITCGDCYRNHDIPFVFYPHLEYVSSDCCLGDNQVHFSLRIKILFCNRFCCVKYV